MADSSSFLRPLCERISYKSYVLRALCLTILGLLLSLLTYRILHMNQNDTVWVVAFICESCFSFIWLLIINIIWSPADHKPYPDRLEERIHDLPSVDIFVTTADPVREPSIILVNTVLSLLAVNYPANKLACYVSDDGCSPLTYFSLKEALRFAKIWVPFCKKYNVKVRAPFRYFLDPLTSSEDADEFNKDWEMTKGEYEKLSQRVEYATQDSNWLHVDDDFEAFSNTKPNDHSTIVKVIWENMGDVGDEKEVPHFVYISREKRPNCTHHYKAGAMNFLVRVSGLMTNSPYMLNVDCDMYANEADVVKQAMCVFLQESINPDHCAFVQFPQAFYDSKANELNIINAYFERGIAGIQGSVYTGSGCFHTRRVMYGLSPNDLEYDGSLSSIATRNILTDEESLVKEFGNSKDMVKSVVRALQRISNPQNALVNSIKDAKEVGSLLYEYQTSWGKSIGWLYNSITEDLNTSIVIHSRGWTSSCIYSDPPAFLGCMPLEAHEEFLQWRRWSVGGLEIFFNKQSPLLGMFHKKLRFRQRMVYLIGTMRGLSSIPMLLYCLLPAYCLLHGSLLFPKVLCLGTTLTLVGMLCLYSLWELKFPGFSVQLWYSSICGALFSIFDITLKLLGISKTLFIVSKKTMPETKSGLGKEPSEQEDGSLFYLPGTFILLVNLAALAYYLMSLPHRSRGDGGGGSGMEEACGCMVVAMLFLPFLKGLFVKDIPLFILCKAAFLAVLFIVFSMGK